MEILMRTKLYLLLIIFLLITSCNKKTDSDKQKHYFLKHKEISSNSKFDKKNFDLKYVDYWHKGTFDSVEDSMEYHLMKHGKGRTIEEYTNDAMNFYNKNKNLGKTIQLKDGTFGIKIQTGKGKNKIGGYWTNDRKIVSFWD
jgi:hypothetical protein